VGRIRHEIVAELNEHSKLSDLLGGVLYTQEKGQAFGASEELWTRARLPLHIESLA
jgi:hypothetical protein